MIFYATQKGLSATDILARTRGSIAWAVFYGLFVVAASVHAPIGLRTVLAEWTPLSGRASGDGSHRVRRVHCHSRPAGRGGRGAAVIARLLAHRGNALVACSAGTSALGNLALAAFLPLHFLALGLAIEGDAKLEGFLRWSDQPLVKLGETILVFLLAIHMLGGLRLLVLENVGWLSGQKRLALLAAAASAVAAFVFLARVF